MPPPSIFRSGTTAALFAAAVTLLSPRAQAQSCCAAPGLVAPTRLRLYERYGMGLQAQARTVFGSFDHGGQFASNADGNSEWGAEQDVLAAIRFGTGGQAALQVPLVQTRRTIAGVSEWGGGLGDITLSGRYDLFLAGESDRRPGVAVLATVQLPTGRPADSARGTLAADATGTGSWEAGAGLSLEQLFGRWFALAMGSLTYRSARETDGIQQSFALRISGLAAAGYTFASEASLGLFATAQHRGESRDQRGEIDGSAITLLTAGVATAIPLGDWWRLQGGLHTEIPLAGWGRNQNGGVGLTASLLRVWL